MKKFDLCAKAGTFTDKNGNEKVNWENVGVMMENGNDPYLLIKPYINFAGFPREEGRSNLIVSMFEHKEQEQQSSRNNDRKDFSAQDTVIIMAKFKVAITLTETQIFIIEVDNNAEAIGKISDAWDYGEIELDYNVCRDYFTSYYVICSFCGNEGHSANLVHEVVDYLNNENIINVGGSPSDIHSFIDQEHAYSLEEAILRTHGLSLLYPQEVKL